MTDNNNMKLRFSQNLKALLGEQEQKKVAVVCDVAESTLHGWINESIPSFRSIGQIHRIANYFGVSMDELLFGQIVDSDQKIHLNHKIHFNGKKLHIVIEEIHEGEENE